MRLLTFLTGTGTHVGISAGEELDVIDLQASLARSGGHSPQVLAAATSMLGVIEAGDTVMNAARRLLTGDRDALVAVPYTSVRLGPPLPNPRTIYCIGLNYAAHSTEFRGAEAPIPTAPVVFSKPIAVTGPGDPIDIHDSLTSELDYEAELAVIIGRRGRDIRAADAFEYVFGYTCLNDITARDLQRRHSQWLIGKSLEGFCPIGPAIVERDDVSWPPALSIECRVNGEIRQRDNTSRMIFGIPALIECLSAGRTLRPGDIIATGTPAGVAMAMDPPRFLRRGQSVSVWIEKIGELVNVCDGSAGADPA
jgi:2-keto-4-pentenoate hydratase/2-oxohepta-3-ene-1,7-dioic acid hydratase in catechol pathway